MNRLSKTLLLAFGINIIVALGLLLGLNAADDLKTFIREQFLRWQADLALNANPLLSLIAIDELSHRQWGSPLITPRDKLKQLIAAAVKGGANVVSVDIELAHLSHGCLMTTPSACPVVQLQADAELGLYLQLLNERAFDDRQADDLPIIILRRLYRKPIMTNGESSFWQQPPSFFDAYLQGEKNVFWGGRFLASTLKPRQWPLAALVCKQDHLTVALSLPLLTAVAQRYTCADSTRNAAYMIRDWKRRLDKWAAQLPCDASQGTTIAEQCQHHPCPDLTLMLPAKLGVCDQVHTIDLAQGNTFEPILYRLTPHVHLKQISAHQALTTAIEVEQHIVLIGQTHQASSDFYSIPIDTQPVASSYVTANAVDTVLRHGQLSPARWIVQLCLTVAIVFLLTLIVQLLPLITALIINIFIMIALLAWEIFYSWPQGMGIDWVLICILIYMIKAVLHMSHELDNS